MSESEMFRSRAVRRVCGFVFCALFVPFTALAENERPQVRVEARILEWQRSNDLDVDFAVAYTRDSGGGANVEEAALTLMPNDALSSAARVFFDEIEAASGSFDAVVEVLETAGTVRILSKPYNVVTSAEVDAGDFSSVKVDPAYTATLSNETEIPYETAKAVGPNLVSVTEYQKAGVSLVVSVQKVIDNNLVVLTMDSIVSDVTGFVNVGLNSQGEPMRVPKIDRRSIKNRLIVPHGKVFIAGLMKTTQQVEQRRGIPWLGELPVLKYIFSRTRMVEVDKELVFLVKAEILTPYRPVSFEDGES
ncbi:MAG: hypothetical protein JXR25_03585 [Pontiellaceae bacterium]|nr:hypothetical protein [Pontiellaceae bacterium]MBN2783883.1 hypothetical protein [Pontiellaceae bacterium]